MSIHDPKGFSQIILIILIITVVVIIGGGVFWVVSQQSRTNQNTNTANVNTTVNPVNQNLNTAANQNSNENTNAASNQNMNSTTNQNANTITNQNVNTPLNTNNDPTVNWKTYRNEEIGIEFKYPNDFHIDESSNVVSILNYDPRSPNTPDVSATDSPFYKLEVIVLKNNENLNLETWVDNYIKNSQTKITVVNKKTLTMDNQATIWNIERYESSNVENNAVYIRHKDSIYSLNSRKNSLFENTFNAVVGHFNFISNNETTDWKIYRNEKYGFEVKYPGEWNYQETGSGQTTPAGVKFSDVDFKTYSPAPGTQADRLINITLYKVQQTIDEYAAEDLSSKDGSKSLEEIQISDQRGIKTRALSEDTLSLAAYTRKGDHIYIFESRVTKENLYNEIEAIFNLIITKFKHIE